MPLDLLLAHGNSGKSITEIRKEIQVLFLQWFPKEDKPEGGVSTVCICKPLNHHDDIDLRTDCRKKNLKALISSCK